MIYFLTKNFNTIYNFDSGQERREEKVLPEVINSLW